MFYLRTGTPGAGKTLSLIDDLRHVKDRPIYYHGIPDLKLDWVHVDDPLDYHNQIPDGSIFVLDECQKHFPVRPPKDKVPDAISFIETHRHRGIDLYFITQHPSLLDHHARRLVGHHTHFQRNFGMPFSVRYTNNKLFDSTNWHELQSCEKSNFRHPKDVFNLYKSAEIHTHKPRFPKKLLWIIPLLLLIGGGIYGVKSLLDKKDKLEIIPTYNTGDNSVDSGPGPVSGHKSVSWSTAFIPAIPGQPYTAPLYQDLAKPSVMPVLAGCVYSAKTQKCQCYTQQATRIDMSQSQCLDHVENSAFNPFLSPRESNSISEGESHHTNSRYISSNSTASLPY